MGAKGGFELLRGLGQNDGTDITGEATQGMEPPGGGGGVTGSEVLTHLVRNSAEIPGEIA